MTYYRNQRDALDKDNYDHSQFVQTRITALGTNRALVDQTYRRYRKDETLLLEGDRDLCCEQVVWSMEALRHSGL